MGSVLYGNNESHPHSLMMFMHACTYMLFTCLKVKSKDWSTTSPLTGDCVRELEVSERVGVFLWLRCRLALVRSLVAQLPVTAALFAGMAVNLSFLSELVVLDKYLGCTYLYIDFHRVFSQGD